MGPSSGRSKTLSSLRTTPLSQCHTLVWWTLFGALLCHEDVNALTHIEYRRSAFEAPPISMSAMGRRHKSWTTIRFATTYLPDDWVEDDFTDSSSTSTLFGSVDSMIPPILQTPEWVAPLARLAAGHNPHGGLQLHHIEQVTVRNVAPSHVDLEAVVCEQDGCVSLLVPVPFTEPCAPAAAFEDCVLRNIQALDSVQLQKANTPPGDTADFDTTTTSIEYPSWWIYPTATTSAEFTRECTALQQILNEPDVRADVITVVTKELRRMLSIDSAADVLQVQQALAVAVGASGMIFRVQALYYGQVEVVDVPIPFAAGGLVSVSDQDARALRESVLACIEQAAP